MEEHSDTQSYCSLSEQCPVMERNESFHSKFIWHSLHTDIIQRFIGGHFLSRSVRSCRLCMACGAECDTFCGVHSQWTFLPLLRLEGSSLCERCGALHTSTSGLLLWPVAWPWSVEWASSKVAYMYLYVHTNAYWVKLVQKLIFGQHCSLFCMWHLFVLHHVYSVPTVMYHCWLQISLVWCDDVLITDSIMLTIFLWWGSTVSW